MALVLTSFSCARTGRIYRAGEVVADDDPAIPGREAFFDARGAGLRVSRKERVEQTTAAPGELRNSRRGRPPTADSVIDEAGPGGNVAEPSDGEGRRGRPRPSPSG